MANHQQDLKKEWFMKSKIDYHAPFVTLWLSCNSWYNFHYGLANDREHINEIKRDTSNKNKVYIAFKNLLESGNPKERANIYNCIEQLHYALIQAELVYSGNNIPNNSKMSLSNALMDFNANPKIFENLIIDNAKTKSGKLKNQFASAHGLGTLVLNNDSQKIFAGLFEVIYQVRCHLVHGSLEPNNKNHEVARYCYLILFECLKGFCG